MGAIVSDQVARSFYVTMPWPDRLVLVKRLRNKEKRIYLCDHQVKLSTFLMYEELSLLKFVPF